MKTILKYKNDLVWSFVVLAGLLLLFRFAAADTATSTSFTITNGSLGLGGTDATSTSFELLQALGTVSPGQSSSSNFTVLSGPLNFNQAAFVSDNWRWYSDVNDETPTSSLAAENTAPVNIANQTLLKLRVTLKNTNGTGVAGEKFRIQYSTYSDFSNDVHDMTEIASCTASSTWCYGDGIDLDNDPILNRVLTDSNATGTHNESGISTSSYLFLASSSPEFEFTLKDSAAAAGTTYFFRAFDTVVGTPVSFDTGKNFPSLLTAGSALTFSVSGLSNGTTTGGVATNTTSTPTSIDFGTLPFNTSTIAAQRLTVNTNATQGYEIYMFEGQGLLGSAGGEIVGVSSTNANPLGWGTACAAGQVGCYGYHTTDATLAGGSARFAPDDTYAKLSTSSDEIAYSPTPVTNDVTDVVFRVQVAAPQDVGSYSSALSYIVVPTF